MTGIDMSTQDNSTREGYWMESAAELLTTRKRGAARLGISEQTLDRIWRQHNLPVIRLGRSVRLSVSMVEQLAREGAPSGSGSDAA